MRSLLLSLILFSLIFAAPSCVIKRKYRNLKSTLEATRTKLTDCEKERNKLDGQLHTREEQVGDLKEQLKETKTQRDKQFEQVGDLTILSQSANENIKKTLQQLEQKDKYIHHLQNARTKADSINLALAVNLKSVLKNGLDDQDVEVKVDKTVVFINLSDKMLYETGSHNLTYRANEVLGKIAQIIEKNPQLEVMVEGYTDNVPIKTTCIDDNWDLSVKRATSVVRVLQNTYKIDPNRLIAAGRGEFNRLVANDSEANKAINRRTRIIILLKMDQFYDLLSPKGLPE